MSELWRLSAAETVRRVRAGEISVRKRVEASLARIAEMDGDLKAFITVCGERALAEADAADRELLAGRPPRALEGVPLSVKDLTDTEGVRTTYGSLLHAHHVPVRDEVCVARLREAGAILVGKTNTPEFGTGPRTVNRLFGPTANPYDLKRSSGGSSGGAAASVSAGLAPLAHGTDFGGSVRTPASFCGVVGVRPTPGLIPSASKPLPWNALATHGVIARNVEDATLMLSTMIGHDPRDPLSKPCATNLSAERIVPETLRFGCSADLGFAPMAKEVRKAFDAAIEKLAAGGLLIETAFPNCSGADAAFKILRAGLMHGQNHALVERSRDQLTAPFIWNVERGAGLSADDFIDAEKMRGEVFACFMRFFENHDALLLPSAAVPPILNTLEDIVEIDGKPLGSVIDYLAITYVISLVGMPCLSLPCGFFADGLPMGMQIVVPPYCEARLLVIAGYLEANFGFTHRWPGEASVPIAA